MSQKSYDYGKEKARQFKDHMAQELDELCEPYDEEDLEEFWQGFRDEV